MHRRRKQKNPHTFIVNKAETIQQLQLRSFNSLSASTVTVYRLEIQVSCIAFSIYAPLLGSLSLPPARILGCVGERHLLHKQISFYSRFHVVYPIHIYIHTDTKYIKAIQSARVFDGKERHAISLCAQYHTKKGG